MDDIHSSSSGTIFLHILIIVSCCAFIFTLRTMHEISVEEGSNIGFLLGFLVYKKTF